ncbi:RNA polymerase sigma factor [Lutimonas sp.]|uniref:RNA polymerase sigma factor n=1 Tax=Lutimonas sp. TaxID=1872403 RepID=UPI003D9B485E
MTEKLQEHLIEKCMQNDSRAQMQLYDLYCKAMFNTAYNFIKDDAIAQDVMQEAFIKAFKKIGTYTGEATFGAWLKRIVINQSLDWLKKKKLATVELNEEVVHMPSEENLEVDSDTSLAVIYKCIEELPQKCKNVVKLYLIEGYDHQEVAQILEISEVASRSQLSRGKSKLKELLIHANYES